MRYLFSITLLLVASVGVSVPGHAQGYAEGELHGDCTFCHFNPKGGGRLILDEPELCEECHQGSGDHPIRLSVNAPRSRLPLKRGEMTCVTCHDPHASEPLQLRLQPPRLCQLCHQQW